MKLPLYTVDAFASKPFTGNPAAVCPLDEWLDDELLQAIAAQNNLAETVYFVRSDDGCYHIRWFTPAVEVPLCGHATLASAFVLKTELGETAETVRFHSKSGLLSVSSKADLYTMDFPAQLSEKAAVPEAIVNALGANPVEFYKSAYYMAVFNSEEIVASIEPDFAALGKVPHGEIIITAQGNNHDFVSRFFAPCDGIDEDPVTGSAHCILTPFWAKRLKKNTLTARQISKRGGELTCELAGERVKISGRARLYSKSTIFV